MTTQEYIKKEAEKYATIQIGDPAKFENNEQIDKYENEVKTFSDGLTAGIELAKEMIMEITVVNEKRAIQLIEIFLTERNEK